MAGLIPFNRKNKLMGNDFEDFFNVLDDFFTPRSLSRGTFKLDVQETDKEYLIEAELPGINKEEINLDLCEGRLTISVNREENVEEKQKNYIHRERRYSSMSRSVYLADADPKGIKAKLDQGLLTVTVHKQENPENAYKIEIE